MADFYNLDLEFLKNDIKNYIATNSTLLEDYNYEGSAISNMINVLAYVTQYNMFYLNTVSKELFLSSSQIDTNVHRLANMLNYIPKRNVSPSCQLVLTNNSENNDRYLNFGETFLLGEVTTTYMGEVMTIPPKESVTVSVYEGELINQQWVSDGTPYQKYKLIDKEKVDNRFVYVGVGSDQTYVNFDWININLQNPIIGGKYYYIDYLDGMFIKFDNGSLYQTPKAGEAVTVRYLKTQGDIFGNTVLVGLIPEVDILDVTGICLTNLGNGENAESLDEIKSRAILNYTTQNRAITENDYDNLFFRYSGYSEFQDFVFFGGEKVYIDIDGLETEYAEGTSWKDVGYVYFSGLKKSDDPYKYGYLTSQDKQLIENFYDPYKIITVFLKFVDPVVIYFNPTFRIKLNTAVNFDSLAFKDTIDNYLTNNYTGMNLTVSKSNIIKYIDSISVVKYSDLDFTTFAKVNKDSSTYSIINLGVKLEDIESHFFGFGTISENVEVGYVIKNEENEAKIIDTNNHEAENVGLFSVDILGSSTFSDGSTVDILNIDGDIIYTGTLSDINRMYINTTSTMSDIFVYNGTSTVTVGYVNCDTGFMKIDNYVDTMLEDMNTFGFNFTLEDDISFTTTREVFVCPESSNITYL